jgi:hypothetical protein
MLTLSNAGQQALSLSGLSFTGADAADFLLGSDTCLGVVEPESTCQLTISFAPEAEGSRSASLQIQSNDYANSPASVPLSGTGGQLPQGPAGQSGASGAVGATGATGASGATGATGMTGMTGASGGTGAAGPQGPAGQIELAVRKKITKTVTTHGHKHESACGNARQGWSPVF